MFYTQSLKTRRELIDFFSTHDAAYPDVAAGLQTLFDDPTLGNARAVLRSYFKNHKQGDIDTLQKITHAFADKQLVRGIVGDILKDNGKLDDIAKHSYPHPIGFDKLVLYQDRETGFKFRLHAYWRTRAEQADLERLHLHKFEMASAIVTGELTNHIWQVVSFRPDAGNTIVPDMALSPEIAGAAQKTMHAYSGYWRDGDNALHKKYLGEVVMQHAASDTFTTAGSYAQILEDAHYVETNAETGASNGDNCSTVYIHGPNLKDGQGRRMPILFEETRLANDDQVVKPIESLTREKLVESLTRYQRLLDQSLSFYEWIYDPKHGRSLDSGLMAGYLLSEHFQTPHTIAAWETRYPECRKVLAGAAEKLHQIVRGEIAADSLPADDRTTRYFKMLAGKAAADPDGAEAWFDKYGNLTREMWRYVGALRGEYEADMTVLKPIWKDVVGRKLPGGMHYGPVSAMIEAAFDANPIAMRYFNSDSVVDLGTDKEGVVTTADYAVEDAVRKVLREHYPKAQFVGEHNSDTRMTPPAEGDTRFLVDAIDGTTNFLNRREDFAISLAHQRFMNGQWATTEAVVSAPAAGQIYWAEKGKGAYIISRNDLEEHLDVPHFKDVSQNKPLERKAIDVSARGLGRKEFQLLKDLFNQRAAVRMSGAAALMLIRTAGRGNRGAIVTANDYDIAAGQLIAEEAGVTVSAVTFDRIANGRKRSFTATIAGDTPAIHNRLSDMVKEAVIPKKKKSL